MKIPGYIVPGSIVELVFQIDGEFKIAVINNRYHAWESFMPATRVSIPAIVIGKGNKAVIDDLWRLGSWMLSKTEWALIVMFRSDVGENIIGVIGENERYAVVKLIQR